MNLADLRDFVARRWDDDVVPKTRRLRPHSGQVARTSTRAGRRTATSTRDRQDAEAWCRAQRIDGMTIEVVAIDGPHAVPAASTCRRPADSRNERTVLFYGHLDKQPEMTGWREGLGPWTPLIEDGKLYGRGGADDGYAIFASLTDDRGASQAQGVRAAALRRHHRNLRGERQLRPAGVPRAARAAHRRRATWSSASTRAAATTSSCGRRRRCADWSAAR